MKVRQAQVCDIPWLTEQLREFAASLGTRHSYIPATAEGIQAELGAMISNHVLLVSLQDDTPTGCIGGLLAPHAMNNELTALVERFWWVDPKYRGGRSAYVLLKEFLSVGDNIADVTVVSLEQDSNVSEKMLSKLGLKLYERSFAKES